jgi:hypothetical protein
MSLQAYFPQIEPLETFQWAQVGWQVEAEYFGSHFAQFSASQCPESYAS